jgi:hypothetical protein
VLIDVVFFTATVEIMDIIYSIKSNESRILHEKKIIRDSNKFWGKKMLSKLIETEQKPK